MLIRSPQFYRLKSRTTLLIRAATGESDQFRKMVRFESGAVAQMSAERPGGTTNDASRNGNGADTVEGGVFRQNDAVAKIAEAFAFVSLDGVAFDDRREEFHRVVDRDAR